jgi:subtilisin family serine protease
MHSKNFTAVFKNKIFSNHRSIFKTHSFLCLNLLKFKIISIILFWGLLLFDSGIYSQTTDYSPDRVIVKLRKGTDALSIQSLKKNMRASVHRQYRLVKGLQVWRLSGVSVERIIDQYKNDPSIEYIEPDYLVKAFDTIPNDPYFSELWGLHNTGQTGGTVDVDIDAPAAWDIETGTDILIGVIDTGVDYNHVDLADNIWINPGEIPNNNQDDDGNGYIDDIRGWDFVNNDNDPFDDNGHGTHCSGTIAGVGNNGTGVVGVNWHAKILPIKFLDDWGSGNTSDAIAAVEYATRMGVRLTSNSWGGGGYSQGLYDAIEAARDSNQLFIAAAGNDYNDNDNWPTYPCSYDLENIISIAATDHNDFKASFSNWGATTVDLGAPGVDIYSTTPGNSYESHDGTSMAAPHVAGAAGLIWAYVPGLTALQVKNTIMVSTDTIPAMENITVTGGRLNVYKALLLAEPDSIPPADILDLAVAETASNWVILSWTASGDDENSGKAAKYDIRYSNSPINDDNFDAATKATVTIVPKEAGMEESFKVKGLDVLTTYYFSIKVIDEQGNASNASNSPSTTTLGYPAISYTPSSFIQNALTGEQHIQLLNISNTGEGVLDFAFPDFGASTSLGVTGTKGDQISLQLINPSGQLSRKDTHNDSGREMHDVYNSAGKSYILFEKIMQPKIQADSTIFYDDMESGTNGWTTELYNGTTDNLWHQTHISYNSANTSWWCGIEAHGDYNTGRRISTALISPSINITSFGSPIILQFFEYYDTQYGWDYCMVDISTDEGDSWTPLRGEYGSAPCGYSQGWILTTLDLSDYSGEIINLRFYFDTGDSNNNYYPGWFIDDVLITASGISWLSFNPTEGSIPTGEDMDVEVIFNASRLYGGTYETDIIIANNDPENSIITIPATFQVTGAPDIDISANNIDYDSVFVNVSKTDSIIIKNLGTDTLHISDIQVNNPVFALDNSLFSLAPRKSKTIVITFTPSASAIFSGTLTISSNDSDEPSLEITLQGTGVTPPDINLSTETLNENLYTGQQAVQTFTIHNDIPEGSNLIFDIYTMEEEQSSLKIENIKIKKSGMNKLPIKTYNNESSKECYQPGNIDLQWKGQLANLPFYDGFEDGDFDGWIDDGGIGTKIVTSNTAAKGQYSLYYNNFTDGHFHGIHQEFPVESQPEYVSFYIRSSSISNHDAYIVLLDNNFSDIIWFFARGNGYLYVNADVGGDESYAYNANQWYHIEFRDINWIDKNFDYYVDNVLIKEDIPFRNALYANDITSAYLYNYTSGAQAWWDEIRIGGSYTEWLSLDPISGTVPADSSLDIEVTFNASGMEQGDYNSNIIITSNDPDESEVSIAAHLHVTGAPDIYAETDTLDFGEVFENDTVYLPVVIHNKGTRDLLIRSAETDNPDFTVTPQIAGVDPDETEVFTVRFIPSALGISTGTLTLENNDPDKEEYIIELTGVGIEPPQIAVTPDSLSETLYLGEEKSQFINIENVNGSDLKFTIYATENEVELNKKMLLSTNRVTDTTHTSNKPPMYYQAKYLTHSEINKQAYSNTVLIIQDVLPWDSDAIREIITENSIDYDVIISSAISSTNLSDYKVVIVASDQYTSTYSNIAANYDKICDYVNHGGILEFHAGGWGWNGGDPSIVQLPGNVHIISSSSSTNYIIELDHEIVHNVPNPFYGSGASHAAFTDIPDNAIHIVRDEYNMTNLIEYQYGRGVVVAGGQTFEYGYDHGESAGIILQNMILYTYNISMWPAWISVNPDSGTVHGGSSLQVEVIFSAADMDAGTYDGNIVINSNDPENSELIIPIHLLVKGNPRITTSTDSITFNETFIGYSRTDSLVIENTGTDSLIISNITTSDTIFSVDQTSLTILPDEQIKLAIHFMPSDTIKYSEYLTIISNDTVHPNLNISLTGYGVHPPGISSAPDSIKIAVGQGDSTSATLTLGNTGLGTLNWEVIGLSSFNSYKIPSVTAKAHDPDATAKQEVSVSLKGITANLIELNDLKIGFTNIGNYDVIISDLTARGATVEEVTTINNTVLNNLDILALDDQIAVYSPDDIALIRTWLENGNSLLLQADNLNSMSKINELLTGSGVQEVYNTYDHSETLTSIDPHPVTENVHSVQAVLARGYCNVSSPALSIILDDSSNSYAAVSSLGSGRLVVVGNEIASSINIDLGDTRLFCNQIFDWLAESTVMISFLPQSGVIKHNNTQEVTIKINAQNLQVKEYIFAINIGSNDPLHTIIQIPLIVTVNHSSNIVDPYSQIPKTYVLMQNYPNPFNPVTHIRYGLPKAGHVEIIMYNILGQRVLTLVDEYKKAGYHLIQFNADHYASGMYIYRMKSDNFTKVKKMILLK